MRFVHADNRLFALARSGRRLPHIALAIPLSVGFILVSQIAGGVPMFLALGWLLPDRGGPLRSGLFNGLMLAAAFGLIFVVLWLWLRWAEKRPLHTLGLERSAAGRKYARGFVLGLAMFVASLGLMGALGYVEPEAGGGAQLSAAALGGVLMILAGWAVQGAGEEVLLRGWLMNVIGARYRPWLGVAISSLLFAILHGLNPNLSPVALVNLGLFGLFTALYALWEESLWGVCALHSAWNWVQGNVVGMQVSGNAEAGPMLFNLREIGPDLVTGGAFGPEGGLAVTAILLAAIGLLAWLGARRRPAASSAE